MARSVCGAHVFPGGEDASVEFFVQDQRSRTEGRYQNGRRRKDLIRLLRGPDPFCELRLIF